MLVAVVVPAENRGKATGPQDLGHEDPLPVADGRGPPGCGGRLALALLDRFIERVDAGVVPRLVAIDEDAGAPGLLADGQSGIVTLDHQRPPAVEGQRRVAAIVELALDDDAA